MSIKIENIVTLNEEQLRSVIMGARNPMNSWDRSDTSGVDIGDADLNLLKRLRKAGTDHRKYLRMIPVWMDITAPLYWWSEYDTYKVGTVANSCSKMHKLMSKPFSLNDFSFDKICGYKYIPDSFVPEINEKSEQWLRLKDTDYWVSNCGRVRHNQLLLGGSHHKDGYIFVTIKGKQTPVHRLVANMFLENPKQKKEVNHIDGNKKNNYANNLEWVTRSENQIHAVRNNLQPKDLSTYTGKFTKEERENIKKDWYSGFYSKRKLAQKYNVSHTCINDVIKGKYLYETKENIFENVARPLVDMLNELRNEYLAETDEVVKRSIWYSIIQLLPSSYNQKRTVFLNFEVLLNMYHARKNHKLDEWQEFCKTVEQIPLFKELCLED